MKFEFNNDSYELGVTIRYKHFIYHFRYLKLQHRLDIGRQYL